MQWLDPTAVSVVALDTSRVISSLYSAIIIKKSKKEGGEKKESGWKVLVR